MSDTTPFKKQKNTSHTIPFEIQVEIIKKLPVKSLIQFQSVSKTWKSLIGSSYFISRYSGHVQHLLVNYEDSVEKYVSIVDDDTFPQHKDSVPIHPLVKNLKLSRTIGSSHGLLCLDGDYEEVPGVRRFATNTAVIWNPSIRKAVAIVIPDLPYVTNATVFTNSAFGVCRETSDPKIVMITHVQTWTDVEDAWECQVDVFTLSTLSWRSSYNNLPRKSIEVTSSKVVIDGILYWLATDVDGEFRTYNLVILFDLTSEEFREVNLPHSLAQVRYYTLSMSQLRESPVVIDKISFEGDIEDFGVWMMEDGVQKSFKMLYRVRTHKASIKGFTWSGEHIIEIEEHGSVDLTQKQIKNLGINGSVGLLKVYLHMESLLLLDQPNSIIYDTS